MDIFTFPDKAAGGFGYAYIMMALLFIAVNITLYKLKKADKKAKEEVAKIEAEMAKHEAASKQSVSHR
ncbi:hypothetical protein BKP35_10180 [Anaerobacillus arseniciselenatis]|uniref:Heme exporter protein D n=1 Tax=Anaerobacillus arseniciselenatis TaxID=85682 RepID=A0A1S2LK79_9BACI|nr:hypothetical protein [Anaerobacillus arseniciselenatis]OIJ12922.1 hypothetical protein BKP35_10180 [Anaerobacillus arseniciselenatis]